MFIRIEAVDKKIIENREKIEEKTGKHLTKKCGCDKIQVWGFWRICYTSMKGVRI
jgi:hypothetical protein